MPNRADVRVLLQVVLCVIAVFSALSMVLPSGSSGGSSSTAAITFTVAVAGLASSLSYNSPPRP